MLHGKIWKSQDINTFKLLAKVVCSWEIWAQILCGNWPELHHVVLEQIKEQKTCIIYGQQSPIKRGATDTSPILQSSPISGPLIKYGIIAYRKIPLIWTPSVCGKIMHGLQGIKTVPSKPWGNCWIDPEKCSQMFCSDRILDNFKCLAIIP